MKQHGLLGAPGWSLFQPVFFGQHSHHHHNNQLDYKNPGRYSLGLTLAGATLAVAVVNSSRYALPPYSKFLALLLKTAQTLLRLPLLFSLYCSPYCYGSRLENAIGLPDTQDYILLYSLVLTKTTIICKIIESSMILGCCPTIVFIWSKWRSLC